jgi:hypothetical protein
MLWFSVPSAIEFPWNPWKFHVNSMEIIVHGIGWSIWTTFPWTIFEENRQDTVHGNRLEYLNYFPDLSIEIFLEIRLDTFIGNHGNRLEYLDYFPAFSIEFSFTKSGWT